jgi:predicted transglutaminase-like cysteine proteinase
MRLAVKCLLATLAMVAVSIRQDADAAIDPHAPALYSSTDQLNHELFDRAPKGFPSLSRLEPYGNVFASIAPFESAPPTVPTEIVPEVIPLEPAHDNPRPDAMSPVPAKPAMTSPDLTQHAAITSETARPEVTSPKSSQPEGNAAPSIVGPTVSLPELPRRRPRSLGREQIPSFGRIEFDGPTLAPLAHTRFCLKYPRDCRAQKVIFRGRAIDLTAERRAALVRINAEVNREIRPMRMHEGIADEKWLISPRFGDCNDYAVTKRHKLLALGWPARNLLLAEVVTTWGEHHLVLVVRTSDGDLVADSLDKHIRDWSKTPYQWVRVESPANPMFWATVKVPQPDVVAMAGHDRPL